MFSQDTKIHPQLKHGWYSEKQIKAVRNIITGNSNICPLTHIYLDINDREVEVTSVTNTKEHSMKFDDVVYVGPVTRWLRHGRKREDI